MILLRHKQYFLIFIALILLLIPLQDVSAAGMSASYNFSSHVFSYVAGQFGDPPFECLRTGDWDDISSKAINGEQTVTAPPTEIYIVKCIWPTIVYCVFLEAASVEDPIVVSLGNESANIGPGSFSLWSGPSGLTYECIGDGEPVPEPSLTPPPTLVFKVDGESSATIDSGDSVVLTWTSTDTQSCAGTGFDTGDATDNSIGVTAYPISDTTYTISCIGDDSSTIEENVTVVVVSNPDLIAGSLSTPVPFLNSGTLTEGANLTFKSFMTNVGAANAIGTFDGRFQIDVGNDGVYDINDDLLLSVTGLLIGEDKSLVSSSWNSVPVGTHAVRFCVDIPGNNILESNEGNNCGANFVFTVALILPPALLFFPDATPIPYDTATNLNWDTSGGGPVDSCAAFVDWTGSKAAGGGVESTGLLTVNQTYELQCTGPGGDSPLRTVTVNVLAEPLSQCEDGDDNDGDGLIDFPADLGCTSATDNTEGEVTINVSPILIRSGDPSTVSWTVTGAPLSCDVTGPGVSVSYVAPVPSSDSRGTGSLTEAATYTITCDYSDGELQAASTVVIVLPKFIEI